MKIYRAGAQIYDLVIDNQTQLSKRLMGEDLISLQVSTSAILDLRVGDYALIGEVKYELNRPAKIGKSSNIEYRYIAQFEGPVYHLLDKIILLDGRSIFSLTGTLSDFIDLLLLNINSIDSGWTKGAMLTTGLKTLTISGQTCKEFLDTLMSTFVCEYNLINKILSTALTIEGTTGLIFEVGKNKGLYELSRESVDDQNTVTRAYIYGSARNLDFAYRENIGRLIFQNTDGTHYLQNTSEYNRIVEKDVVFEDIWPRFTGTVGVVSGDYKTITCNEIDFDLNLQQLTGIAPKAVFLTGDLMGVTFAISYVHATHQLTLTPVNQAGGLVLPSANGYARAGDQFTFIDISLPTIYITNAEADLKVEGQKWLDYYSKLRVRYSLTLDYRYIRDNAVSLKIGDIVRIIDTQLSIDKEIRITALKMGMDGKSVTAEISNYRDEVFSKQITSKLNDTINQLTQNQAAIQEVKNSNTGSRLTGGLVSKTIPNLVKSVTLIDTDKLEAHAVGKIESEYIELSQLSDFIKAKLGVTVEATKTTWDRDMYITGNIFASKEVTAWIAGAVTSDVLSGLSASAPLRKSSSSNIVLDYSTQFDLVGNALHIKDSILVPALHYQDISTINGLQTALDNKLATSLKGSINGLAELDENGWVKNAQLPSYVDDVIEVSTFGTLPVIGESGKIYITTDNNKTWRWSGSVYAEISASLALGETSSTAYRGDRGAIAYNHSQSAHNYEPANANIQSHIGNITTNPHNVTKNQVGLNNVTNNAQWYDSNHPTTLGGYGITDTPWTGYLPLSGGTLTGALGGTSANFTGSINTKYIRATGPVLENQPGILIAQQPTYGFLGNWGINPTTMGELRFYLANGDGGGGNTPLILTSTIATFSGSVTATDFTTTGHLFFTGAGSGSIKLYSAFSGSPANPGFTVTNYAGTQTFSHNSNGGNTYNSGNITVGGEITAPTVLAPLYSIKNTAGAVQWTVSVNSSDNLEFKNASGVVEAVLDQSGNLSAKGEVTAYDSTI